MTTRDEILALIQPIREEADGDRELLYELYGGGIRVTLEPLADLLEATADSHPELVELVALSLQDRDEKRREELRTALMEKRAKQAEAALIWRWSWSMRGGDLESVFTATRAEVEELYGQYIVFGEVLGKHSDVQGTLEADEFEVLSEDPQLVELFRKHVGSTGHSPFDYLEEED